MSVQKPKTFFIKLKEVCKKIDNDIDELKKKVYEDPGNANVAAIKIRDIQDKIKSVKSEANELRFILTPKLGHTEDFIQHFKELTTETEVLISRQESYLQQYGYKPLELVIEAADPVCTEDSVSSPVKDQNSNQQTYDRSPLEIEKVSTTPSLLDYGIVSSSSSGPTSEKDRKSSFDDYVMPTKVELKDSIKAQVKNSDSTPTLDANLADGDTVSPQIPGHFKVHNPAFPVTPTLVL